MGGRGANSGIPVADEVGGGGGNGKGGPMDQMPGQPDTLTQALGKKGRPMATRDAVLKANPFYDRTMSSEEYNANCQRAVIATEARFRGYDVIAQPTYDGDTMPHGNSWANNFVGAKVEKVGRTTARAAQRELEAKMKSYGDGSRAIMSVAWKGRGNDGHVLNVVQRAGKTYYYDGQTGHAINPKGLFPNIRTRQTEIARVDNLAFSDQARESVRTTPRNRRR